MLKSRFLIFLIFFLFVSITPASAYTMGEMQNIFTDDLNELENLKNPAELGYFEQIKLFYTIPKLTYELSEIAATATQSEKTSKIKEPNPKNIPDTLISELTPTEKNQTLQKNLEEKLAICNQRLKGERLKSTRKEMPAIGDVVQLVVSDNINHTTHNKYIRYMVYEGQKGGYMVFTSRAWEKGWVKVGHTEIEPEDFKKVYTGNVIIKPTNEDTLTHALNYLAETQALSYRHAWEECDNQIEAYRDDYWFCIFIEEDCLIYLYIFLSFVGGILSQKFLDKLAVLMNPQNAIEAMGLFQAIWTICKTVVVSILAHPILLIIVGVIILILVVCHWRYKHCYEYGVNLWQNHKAAILDSGRNFLSYGQDTMTIPHDQIEELTSVENTSFNPIKNNLDIKGDNGPI